MGIEIPPQLQWVSYLVGAKWPGGDEDGMWAIGDALRHAAEGLESVIPELNNVRAETRSVLSGDTARAADKQFALLFDGDHSVDKLVDAISALGELAGDFGTELEHTKLKILTALAIAAAEIACAWAQSPWITPAGAWADQAAIEQATVWTIERLLSMLCERLTAALRSVLTRTMVKRLAGKAVYKLEIAVPQEVAIQRYQLSHGHRADFDAERLGDVAIAATVAGAVEGSGGHGISHLLGNGGSNLARGIRGAVKGFSSGGAGITAGELSIGEDVDTTSILGATKSSVKGFIG